MRFIDRYRICKLIIKQMKDGEWEPIYNSLEPGVLTLERDGKTWWVGNGGFFCDSDGTEMVAGFLLRHWVYWAAANNVRIQGNKKHKKINDIRTLQEWTQ